MEKNEFGTNVNLLKLKGAFVRSLQGRESKKVCLIIPIDDADLYQKVDEDLKIQKVTLSLAHFERNEVGQYGDTHIVKQSHSKAWNESHSEEEKKAEPILGNSSPLKSEHRAAKVQEMALTENEFEDPLPF